MKFDLLARPQVEETYKLVGFKVGDVLFGLDIMRIREIIEPGRLIPIPSLPPFVPGVVSHRESIVPIISLRLRFGLPLEAPTRRTKWIIVRRDALDVGLEVDGVTQVLKAVWADRRERPMAMEEGKERWIKDAFEIGKELVFEIDLDKIVGRAVMTVPPEAI